MEENDVIMDCKDTSKQSERFQLHSPNVDLEAVKEASDGVNIKYLKS